MLVDPADLPTLRACFATYLYQSWRKEFAHVDDAVRAFLGDAPGRAAALADEVQVLLAAATDEAELDAWSTAAGADYLPSDDGRTFRGWLEAVAVTARDFHTPATPSPGLGLPPTGPPHPSGVEEDR
ncbi:contact-dependent growth inhibition system immunity protein [Nocardioides kribbensis]|uniref:contact-dependent growth inhibition system immunity protein n=1 Tax=Nocardioides kribbensis TaxID=305517 RepID=UPI003D81BD93